MIRAKALVSEPWVLILPLIIVLLCFIIICEHSSPLGFCTIDKVLTIERSSFGYLRVGYNSPWPSSTVALYTDSGAGLLGLCTGSLNTSL